MNVCPSTKSNSSYSQIKHNHKHKQNLTFKGDSLTTALELIDTNILLDLLGRDAVSMIIPRTVVDFTRSQQAGWETLRGEVGGVSFDTLYPIAAAYGLMFVAKHINNPNKVETRIHANREMMDNLTNIWKNSNQDKRKYVEAIINNIEGLNGSNGNWKNLVDELNGKNIEGIIDTISKAIENNNPKKLKEAQKIILETIGANRNIRLKNNKPIETSLDSLLGNTFDMGRHVFFKDNLQGNKTKINNAIKRIKTLNLWKSKLVLGSASFIGVSIQPLNAYLTKKKTGKEGFVGNPNFHADSQKDKSHNLLLGKFAAASAFGLMILSTITGKGPVRFIKELASKNGFKNFLKKLEFNDKFLNADQLKLTFAALIMGRVFAARDKNELRETSVRDSLGFLHYLVLGGFVTKGVAAFLQHKNKNLHLINESQPFQSTKKGFGKFIDQVGHFISNKSVKSHAEIRTLEKGLVNKNLCMLNLSILSGIAYTCAMLGIGIPLLNKFMTNKLVKKVGDKEAIPPIPINNKIEMSQKNKQLFGQFIKP